MVTLKTPEAPATSKQLWLLHLLTKQDTRNLNLTMQQASDRINELKSNNGKHPQDDTECLPTDPNVYVDEQLLSAQRRLARRDNQRYYILTVFTPSKHRMSSGKYHIKCTYHANDRNKVYCEFQKIVDLRMYTFNMDLYAHVYAKGRSAAILRARLAKGDFTTSDKFGEILKVDYCQEVLSSK